MRYVFALVTASLLASAGLAQEQFPVEPSPIESFGHNAAAVQSWYQRYLGRVPSRIALETLVGQLEGGRSPVAVQARVLGSDDFYRRWGGNPNGFINGLYRVVHARVPSRQEVWYWKRELWRNPNRERLAVAFLDSTPTGGAGDVPNPYGEFGTGYPFDHADGSPGSPR
jgi:hypothetical protein